jgi:hypothetical protein
MLPWRQQILFSKLPGHRNFSSSYQMVNKSADCQTQLINQSKSTQLLKWAMHGLKDSNFKHYWSLSLARYSVQWTIYSSIRAFNLLGVITYNIINANLYTNSRPLLANCTLVGPKFLFQDILIWSNRWYLPSIIILLRTDSFHCNHWNFSMVFWGIK